MIYWSEIYKEIGQRIMDNLPEVQFIDLWHEQVSYLTEELPFPCPAVFIEFNALSVEDTGNRAQLIKTQVDLHLFYETFSDTYMSAIMQDNALEYLNIMTKLNALFHASIGENYGAMRKTDLKREDSGGAGNLYRISFECDVYDYSAEELYNEEQMNGKIKVESAVIEHPTNEHIQLYDNA